MRSHNWFYIWDWNHKVFTYITHCCHKWHQQSYGSNFGILDWNRSFLPITRNIMDKLFFPISCMKWWFLSPIKNLYKELVTIYDSLLTKWKSMWRELLNILWMESSTTFLLIHHLYTTHVYLLTWLSNNLSMLRANRNFDITQLMQTKLGTSIICMRDYKFANPCVQLIK